MQCYEFYVCSKVASFSPINFLPFAFNKFKVFKNKKIKNFIITNVTSYYWYVKKNNVSSEFR